MKLILAPALVLVLASSGPLLFAQTETPKLKTPAQAGAPASFAAVSKRDITPGRKVTIVTTDKPLLRQDCKVEKFTDDQLVCRARSAPLTYHAQDLVAVIDQDHEFGMLNPLRLLGTLGLGGGALAGAALLASIPTAGIPLAVIGGILLIDSIFEALDSTSTTPRERLAFLNPDQRVQIDLK